MELSTDSNGICQRELLHVVDDERIDGTLCGVMVRKDFVVSQEVHVRFGGKKGDKSGVA